MKIKIPTRSTRGKFLLGTYLGKKDSKSLVIFLSGLSGDSKLSLFTKAARFFFKNGFSTLRINICANDKNVAQKSLKQSGITFSTYAVEIENVINYYSSKYNDFVIIGHSFGAIIAILFLNKYKKYSKKINIVFWDPSLLPWSKKSLEKDFIYNSSQKIYRDKHSGVFINSQYYNQCVKINNTAEIFGLLNKNACIITTSEGKKDAKKYFSRLKKKNSKLYTLVSTDHLFSDQKSQKILFQKTLDYLT